MTPDARPRRPPQRQERARGAARRRRRHLHRHRRRHRPRDGRADRGPPARRGAGWTTIEADDELALPAGHRPARRPRRLDRRRHAPPRRVRRAGAGGRRDRRAGVDALTAPRDDPLIVVAEEAGLGPVPVEAPTRRWLDLTGDATQRSRPPPTASCWSSPAARSSCPSCWHRNRTTRAPLHGDKLVRPGDDDFAVNVVAGAAAGVAHRRGRRTRGSSIGAYPDETVRRGAIARRHGVEPEQRPRAQRRRRGLLAARGRDPAPRTASRS